MDGLEEELDYRQIHLVIGFGIELNIEDIKSSYLESGHVIKIHGDGNVPIDMQKINFPEGSNIIINAHGNVRDGFHIMQLKKIGEMDKTSSILENIKLAADVEVRSCFGDVAYHVDHLPVGSTLMSFISSNHLSAGGTDSEYMMQIARFEYKQNVFIKFIFNILITPEDNNLAIRLNSSHKLVLGSVISNLKDYSISGIRSWQSEKIQKILRYIKEVSGYVNEKHSKQINQLNKLFSNNEDITKFILKYNTERYQELLFLNSAVHGHIEIIRSIDFRFEREPIYKDGLTALYYSARMGHIDVVKFLVETRGKIEGGLNGECPLFIASLHGHIEIVKFLVEKGANIEGGSDGELPMVGASQNGHIEIVKFLVEKEANIEARFGGATPLCQAACNGHIEVVKFLVGERAKIEAARNDGVTPLWIASQNGHIEIVKFLVGEGANIEAANIEAANNDGVTPLWIAAQNGHIEIVKFLVGEGANIKALGLNKAMPLFQAAQEGHFEVVKFLVEEGANIEAARNDGLTPLFTAAKNGHFEIVKFLVKNGVNIETATDKKITALSIVAYIGYIEIVKLLLESGANIKEIPLALRISSEVIEVIKEYNIDPVKYVLSSDHKNEAKIIALEKLLKQTYLLDLSSKIEEKIDEIKFAIFTSKIETSVLSSDPIIDTKYLLEAPEIEVNILAANLIIDTKYSLEALEDKSHQSFQATTEQLFYSGYYLGEFIISPAIHYVNDRINYKNLDKYIFDYYSDNFNLDVITKATVFSLSLYSLPDILSLSNKLLIAKTLSDISVNEANLSLEYANSLLGYLVSSFASFSMITTSVQNDVYLEYPFEMGVIASTAGDFAKLSYDTISHCFMVGKDYFIPEE